MPSDYDLPDGHSFVPGRGREQAISLLKAADNAGVDQYEVRRISDGYVVPNAVADEYAKITGDSEPDAETEVEAPVEEKPKRAPRKTAAKSK
jgi:hypothetical protein